MLCERTSVSVNSEYIKYKQYIYSIISYHVSLGLRIKATCKVGNIVFGKTNTRSQRMFVIVFKNASRGIDGTVHVSLIAQIGQIQGSNDIGTNGFGLVCLTPINIGTSCNASGIQHVGGLNGVELLGQSLAIFQTSVAQKQFNVVYNNIKRECRCCGSVKIRKRAKSIRDLSFYFSRTMFLD